MAYQRPAPLAARGGASYEPAFARARCERWHQGRGGLFVMFLCFFQSGTWGSRRKGHTNVMPTFPSPAAATLPPSEDHPLPAGPKSLCHTLGVCQLSLPVQPWHIYYLPPNPPLLPSLRDLHRLPLPPSRPTTHPLVVVPAVDSRP